MRPIVCAISGNEANRRTQERAIELACERADPLLFLFVVDSVFARSAGENLSAVVLDELERLGKWLLAIAQARARARGIQAGIAIRHGVIQQTIEGFLREVNASALVIGVPESDSECPVSDSAATSRFARRIQASADIEVLVVEPPRRTHSRL